MCPLNEGHIRFNTSLIGQAYDTTDSHDKIVLKIGIYVARLWQRKKT